MDCDDLAGGLGKPVDFEKVLMDAGWSRDDINFSVELHRLCGANEDVFDAFVEQAGKLRGRREKSDRWKVLRKIKAGGGVGGTLDGETD
jgi:hypothetical protein